MTLQRILVTGADGFVGRALSARLSSLGRSVVRVVREPRDGAVAVGDIATFERWSDLLERVDAVVHLAARAHVVRESSDAPLAEFRRVNVAATLRLAEAAAAAGVRRFVFLSSIGVNGTSTSGAVFSEADVPKPVEPYAISKWEAEQELIKLGGRTGLQITRLRPPLIVGPGAKGNLHRLIKLVDSGLPLPFGRTGNLRSFVGLDDLCELLTICISHERAAGELFLAANGEQLSTSDLLRTIAAGLERRPRIFSVPTPALRWAASAVGAKKQILQMTSSLSVDATKAREVLGWSAKTPIRSDVRGMAADYLRQARR